MIGLSKKKIISYFLLSVIVSFIDTYIYPGVTARLLSLPKPATVFVVALLLFAGSIVLQKLSIWLRSSSLSWPKVKTIKIEKLVPLYILVVFLLYLMLQNPNYFNIGAHIFGAFSIVIYLVMKNKLPILAKDKLFEVPLQIIIPV